MEPLEKINSSDETIILRNHTPKSIIRILRLSKDFPRNPPTDYKEIVLELSHVLFRNMEAINWKQPCQLKKLKENSPVRHF